MSHLTPPPRHMPAEEPSDTLVFLVDDEPQALAALAQALTKVGYRLETFSNPVEALKAFPQREVSVLLTDMSMPGMDGIQLATRCLESDPDLAVIILADPGMVNPAIRALRLGIEDYLLKPLQVKDLEAALTRAVRRRAARLYHRNMEGWHRAEVEARAREAAHRQKELEQVSVAVLSALIRALEAKSSYFKGHSEAVAGLAETIAKHLRLAEGEVQEVRIAGLLHDIGMIAVPDRIIEKGGELTPQEREQLREHCRTGAEILRPFPHLKTPAEYVLHHHERLDGTGYPDQLKGEAISLGAQVVGMAEAYVALTEKRSFRASLAPQEALETLWGGEGVWYSTRILQSLGHALKT